MTPVLRPKHSRSFRFAILLLSGTAITAVPTSTTFADPIWVGTTSPNWTTGSNWSTGAVPTSAVDVSIDTTIHNETLINAVDATASTVTVGENNTGELVIASGGKLDVLDVLLGENAGASGTLLVEGTNSTLTSAFDVQVGFAGTGEMHITTGGTVKDQNGVVGAGNISASGKGTVIVDGTGSLWNNIGLIVGDHALATGMLTIQNAGHVVDAEASVGLAGQGTVVVTGADSLWENKSLTLGDRGNGTVTVEHGGEVDVDHGLLVGGGNTATAVFGSGSLNIHTGGRVAADFVSIGADGPHSGALHMFDTGSTLQVTNALTVGDFGSGVMNATSGSDITAGSVVLGNKSTASGSLTLAAPGTTLTDNGALIIGGDGKGSLDILTSAKASSSLTTVASDAGSTGDLEIGGAGSRLTTGAVSLGVGGVGTMKIFEGGVLTSLDDAEVAVAAKTPAAVDTVTIDGAGSKWDLGSHGLTLGVANLSAAAVTLSNGGEIDANAVTLGSSGDGNLSVVTGGALHAGSVTMGLQASGTGEFTVDDSSASISDFLTVGSGGGGTLSVLDGGTIADGQATIADIAASSGAAVVDGAGSDWHSDHTLDVGNFGDALLTVSNGGAVSDADGVIGLESGSFSAVAVTGVGSAWTSTGSMGAGLGGNGTLTISAGGVVDVGAQASAAVNAHSVGAIAVDGAGSKLTADGGVGIGVGGSGTLTVSNGGAIETSSLILGSLDGSNGTATITDANSNVAVSNLVFVGDSGAGTLLIKNGGKLTDASAVISPLTDGSGQATVDGAGSSWVNTSDLNVGILGGNGQLTVSNGGMVSDVEGIVGDRGTGAVTVTGSGSAWTSQLLGIGGSGTGTVANGSGTLTIEDGGAVSAGVVAFGITTGSNGVGTVNGANSRLTADSELAVGNLGIGTLAVENGGSVTDDVAAVGGGASGVITVDGAGSVWASKGTHGEVFIGEVSGGDGTVTVSNGGKVSATGVVTIADQTGSIGTVNIGSDAASAAVGAGTFDASSIVFGAGTGTINFNHTSTNDVFDAPMSGFGALNQIAGVTRLTGDSSGFSGSSSVEGGTLLVDGKLGIGSVNVFSGASLGGAGTIGGPVNVGDGGTLLGVQGQTLGMLDLTLTSGANVDVNLSDPAAPAMFAVTNSLMLDGKLNIATAAGFGPGVYRIMDYGGTLTDNGLDIGTTPSGSTASDFTVQTAVAGEVNLVDTASVAATLQFWDGDAAGNAGNGAVDGGDGIWSTSSSNWTSANGATNGAMTPQPGFAVFEGKAGTVTVDDGAGNVAVTGMQFADDGFAVKGDAITLTDPGSVVRVGDGTAAGAGYTAAIGSVLSGTGGLDKTDLGTLVFTGANTYTGGTRITAGTLQLGDGGASGSISGDVADNGALAFDRSDAVNFDGVLSGAGALDQIGSGTTSLTANSSGFTGQTTVSAGTLEVDGTLGAGPVHVQSGGTLAGSGSIGGAVDVAAGGTLSGVEGQTLTMGSLALGNGSTINASLSTPGGAALFAVDHDLTLDGTLDVTAPGGFGPGVYRIINYGGALIDNGLDIGATPAGTDVSDFTVQTAVAGEVNLVDAASVSSTLQFWDGDAAGNAGNGKVDGGNGVWSVAGSEWTSANGATNGAMTPQPGFAIFEGKSGTVTVDDGAGTVAVTGMQFAGNGYTIKGGAITLADAASVLRVGDGTAAGAGYSATIASVLTGTGGLDKTDLGTLVLTGASTYAGGTEITAGTLQLGNGGASGSISGNIADNGTLAFNRSDAVTFAGVISGSGTIGQIGSGSTLLTGDSSAFTGTTTVAGGKLLVGDHVSGSLGGNVNVANGAALGGSGTIGGNVTIAAGGTHTPGNSIGTETIDGNYTNHGTLEIEATPTAADQVKVKGDVDIAGSKLALQLSPANASSWNGTSGPFIIIDNEGNNAINGSFDPASKNLLFLDEDLSYDGGDGNDVALTLTRNNVDFASAALTHNQKAAATGAESLVAGNAVYDAIASAPDAATARKDFDQISGEIHASADSALIEDGRFVREAALDRLRAANAGTSTEARGDGYAAWGHGFGSWGTMDGNGNAATMTRNIGGFFVGADGPISENWRAGIIGGYSRSTFDVGSRASSGSSDNYDLGLYSGAQWGALAFRSGLAYTWHSLSLHRSVGFSGFADSLKSDYDAGTAQAFGEFGYDIKAGQVVFEPFANLAYMNLASDGFSEKGGAAALTGGDSNTSVTVSTLGLRASTGIDFENGTGLTAHGMLGWRHAYGDTTPDTSVAFAGGSSFDVGGVPIARDAAVVEGGLDFQVSHNTTLDLSYSGQFGSGLNDQTLRGDFTVKF